AYSGSPVCSIAYKQLISEEQLRVCLNTFGPRNQLLETAMAHAQVVQPWITASCKRETLRPGSFGAQIWAAVDAGKIPREWAPLLVRSLLSAGLDTTIICSYGNKWVILRMLVLALPGNL